jgi:hypothetical protein
VAALPGARAAAQSLTCWLCGLHVAPRAPEPPALRFLGDARRVRASCWRCPGLAPRTDTNEVGSVRSHLCCSKAPAASSGSLGAAGASTPPATCGRHRTADARIRRAARQRPAGARQALLCDLGWATQRGRGSGRPTPGWASRRPRRLARAGFARRGNPPTGDTSPPASLRIVAGRCDAGRRDPRLLLAPEQLQGSVCACPRHRLLRKERQLITHLSDLLRSSRCARSTPLPSLRCRRPFTARRTLHARVTPACAFPCPLRCSSRAAAPSRVAACAGPAARVRPARRLSAPAARAHVQRGGARREGGPRGGGGAAHARARTAAPRRAPSTCAGLRLRSADLALAVLCSLAPCAQPSSLVATPLHERADHTLGALAARVRR